CVFFAMITRQSPVGLGHSFPVHFDIREVYRQSLEHDRIDAVDAEIIQRAVRDGVRKSE
ncbi:MAG: hypothetical protein JWO56_2346, partial [Acidobacteria bacterium]|nr:hypothetical protein [Acidobacteriota bacterium]